MRLLILGLTGQVGVALQPLLQDVGADVVAFSRNPQPPREGISWQVGTLPTMLEMTMDFDAVLSLGPLDVFASWFDSSGMLIPRIIALGSTSQFNLADSIDASERAVAQRLIDAELTLFSVAARRGVAVTVLRPTLIYGNGRDRSLTPLVAFARRWHFCPVPMTAIGLRQPVHVDDVAAAVLACLNTPTTAGQAFDLPGAEVLSFTAMVRRAVARHASGSRVVRLPGWLFKMALVLVAQTGRSVPGSGRVGRLRRDQLADSGPANQSFGYQPRAFLP